MNPIRTQALIMADADNVATALTLLPSGSQVSPVDKSGNSMAPIQILEDVRPGHKIALTEIPAGEEIFKYGVSIGYASLDIAQGSLVHVHNARSNRIDIPPGIITEILKQMGLEEKEIGPVKSPMGGDHAV